MDANPGEARRPAQGCHLVPCTRSPSRFRWRRVLVIPLYVLAKQPPHEDSKQSLAAINPSCHQHAHTRRRLAGVPHTERGHWMPVVQISPDTKPTARKMPRRPRSE